jgi:hypothetical protein
MSEFSRAKIVHLFTFLLYSKLLNGVVKVYKNSIPDNRINAENLISFFFFFQDVGGLF